MNFLARALWRSPATVTAEDADMLYRLGYIKGGIEFLTAERDRLRVENAELRPRLEASPAESENAPKATPSDDQKVAA